MRHLHRTAKDFSSPEKLEEYLREHPKADRTKHQVVEPEATSKDENGGKDDKSKTTPKGKGKTIPVSPDLAGLPPKIKPDKLPAEFREEIKDYNLDIVGTSARQAIEIARKVREGIEKSTDVCKVSPPVCHGNKGLTRDQMPQIEGEKTVKQLLESDNALDKAKGKAMVAAGADPDSDKTILQHLVDHLEKHGVKTHEEKLSVGKIKATQKEIKAAKVFGMADSHLKGKFNGIDSSVVVSKDGYLLDGHHRWAALLTIDPTRKMKVKVIDMDMDELLKESASLPGVYKADFSGEPLDEGAQKKYKAENESTFRKGKEARLVGSLLRLASSNTSLRRDILNVLRRVAETEKHPEILSIPQVEQLPVGSIVFAWVQDRYSPNGRPDGGALIVIPGRKLTQIAILPERSGGDFEGVDGDPVHKWGANFALVARGRGKLPVQGTAARLALSWWGNWRKLMTQVPL